VAEKQQLRAGFAGDPVDHSAQVLIVHDAAGDGYIAPPAASGPGGRSQPDQLLVGQPGAGAEAEG
jgi:hypothetical protein